MDSNEAIYRLNECECYRAGLRCLGCEIAVASLTKFFNEAITDTPGKPEAPSDAARIREEENNCQEHPGCQLKFTTACLRTDLSSHPNHKMGRGKYTADERYFMTSV